MSAPSVHFIWWAFLFAAPTPQQEAYVGYMFLFLLAEMYFFFFFENFCTL